MGRQRKNIFRKIANLIPGSKVTYVAPKKSPALKKPGSRKTPSNNYKIPKKPSSGVGVGY